MKPTLQLKLSQHLTLTPQLQQSIRLLQLSTLELNAEVERMLQENPLLEKESEDEDGAPPEAAVTAPGTSASEPAESPRASEGDDDRAEEPVDTAEAAEGAVSAPAGLRGLRRRDGAGSAGSGVPASSARNRSSSLFSHPLARAASISSGRRAAVKASERSRRFATPLRSEPPKPCGQRIWQRISALPAVPPC